MKSLPWIARGVAVLAWAGVLATLLGLHPALRGRGLGDTGAGPLFFRDFGFYDPSVPWAGLALMFALVYIALWGLHRIARPGRVPVPKAEVPVVAARSITVLVGALAGQAAASLAVANGGSDNSFYLGAAGVTALFLIPLSRIRTGADPEPPEPATPLRLVVASAVGVLLVLFAGPLDALLSAQFGEKIVPEAWWPVARQFMTPGKAAEAATLAMLQIGAVLALAQGHRPGARWYDGWPALAPAYILVLGASNPIKGLATAFVAETLGRAGGGWITRGAFVVATLVVTVALACAMM